MTADADYTPAYTLDNRWEAARARLEALEASCDPFTASHLDKVGVGPGWHCLEVGAGAGSVARMLCERVGPDGHVLAVDLEPTLLADVSEPNLEVRRLDVVVDELPEAAFDLIHTRLVLVHIPQRDELIPKLVRSLRPGGVLLLEECDLHAAFAADDDVFRPSLEAMYRPLYDAGIDIFWARHARRPARGRRARRRRRTPGASHLHRRVADGRVLADHLPAVPGGPALHRRRAGPDGRGREAIARPGGPWIAWDWSPPGAAGPETRTASAGYSGQHPTIQPAAEFSGRMVLSAPEGPPIKHR